MSQLEVIMTVLSGGPKSIGDQTNRTRNVSFKFDSIKIQLKKSQPDIEILYHMLDQKFNKEIFL